MKSLAVHRCAEMARVLCAVQVPPGLQR